MTNDTTPKTKNPDFHAFTVKQIGENNENHWIRIGAAWYHDRNLGLTIDLDCTPLDGKIVLRVPKDSSYS